MKIVRELMVPLDAYSHVSEDASLFEAIMSLENALHKPQEAADPFRPRDRALLVMDQNNKIIGKLSMWDAIKGLDPRSDRQVDALAMVEDYGLWERPLQNILDRAKAVKAKDLLPKVSEEEYIDENASLNQALHRLITGHHLSLLVNSGKEAVGILRLSDVFREVHGVLKSGAAETDVVQVK
jgi:CBS domain containing-hemolysin-like protein